MNRRARESIHLHVYLCVTKFEALVAAVKATENGGDMCYFQADIISRSIYPSAQYYPNLPPRCFFRVRGVVRLWE